ncbi:MAG TPA: SRPBCC family protein [Xanthobacteraceae bacterium]|nr:SRPBCC family protein [Xanthobacteraceae bacterium]
MSKPSFVYVTYIASTPEKVWAALTDPDLTEQYWFGYRIAAAGKAGDFMTAISPAGKQVHHDPIIESDPPRRLVYAWNPLMKSLSGERPSRVTFTIEPLKGQVRLTVVHDDFEPGSKVFEAVSRGWPAVLSSLKSFLETGRGLESTMGEEDRKRVAEAEAQL